MQTIVPTEEENMMMQKEMMVTIQSEPDYSKRTVTSTGVRISTHINPDEEKEEGVPESEASVREEMGLDCGKEKVIAVKEEPVETVSVAKEESKESVVMVKEEPKESMEMGKEENDNAGTKVEEEPEESGKIETEEPKEPIIAVKEELQEPVVSTVKEEAKESVIVVEDKPKESFVVVKDEPGVWKEEDVKVSGDEPFVSKTIEGMTYKEFRAYYERYHEYVAKQRAEKEATARNQMNKKKEIVHDKRVVRNDIAVEDGDFLQEKDWYLVGRTLVTGLSTTKGRKLVDNEIVHFVFPNKNLIFNSQLIVRFSTKRFGEV